MDRVLITPIKRHSHSHLHIRTSRSRQTTPSRSLRHRPQRTTSSHLFAPYPKRNLNKKTPPRTPNKKMRQRLSAQGYLNGLVAEGSKARLLLNRPVSPKRPGRWTSLFCRSDPLSKDTEHQNSSLDSNACFSTSIPLEEVTTNPAQGSSIDIYSEENIQGFHEMDLELDFQGLHIREQTVGIESSDSWLTPGSAHDAEDICISTPGNPWATGTSRKSKCLVTRLRRALVAETRARQRAEHERLEEMKRRIETEKVVAQLQREREELIQLLAVPAPAASSPVLLPSSPCTSSRVIMTSTLGFPTSTS